MSWHGGVAEILKLKWTSASETTPNGTSLPAKGVHCELQRCDGKWEVVPLRSVCTQNAEPKESESSGETTNARAIVVGDIHGCLEELSELLDVCEFNQSQGDVLICVGDVVNKVISLYTDIVHLAV
jgi:hypothetical protein